MFYSPIYEVAPCDGANAASAVVKTSPATSLGKFGPQAIVIAVGVMEPNCDTGGLATSGQCYIVVRGSSNDSANSAIAFNAPSAVANQTSPVVGNYVDKVGAKFFPVGDTVSVQEYNAFGTAAPCRPAAMRPRR